MTIGAFRLVFGKADAPAGGVSKNQAKALISFERFCAKDKIIECAWQNDVFAKAPPSCRIHTALGKRVNLRP